MLKLAVVAVLLCAASAAPQVGAPICCAPDQWEGQSVIITGADTMGKASKVEVSSMISYDFTDGLLSVSEEFMKDDVMVRNRTIFDYKKQLMYTFNMNSMVCTTMSLSMTFQKACTPEGATPAGDFFYGAGMDRLNASAVMFSMDGAMGYYVYTTAGCIPVTEVVYGTMGQTSFVTTSEFVNITPGIKDMGVFTPPDTCPAMPQKDFPAAKRGPLGMYKRSM